MDDSDVQTALRDLEALQKEDPARPEILFRLGTALGKRGEERGNIDDLTDAIKYHRMALAAYSPEDVESRRNSLQGISDALLSRYPLTNDQKDLYESEDALNDPAWFGGSEQAQSPSTEGLFGLARDSSQCVVSLEALCRYLRATPPSSANLKSLSWYKEKSGIKHEFLVLEAAPVPEGSSVWIRVERAADRSYARTTTFWQQSDSLLSRFPATDTARICAKPYTAIEGSPSKRCYDCTLRFPPPSLESLASLLEIIATESKEYTLLQQNCYFFCSIITEMLKEVFGVRDEGGTLGHLDLAKDVRKRIRQRFLQKVASASTPI